MKEESSGFLFLAVGIRESSLRDVQETRGRKLKRVVVSEEFVYHRVSLNDGGGSRDENQLIRPVQGVTSLSHVTETHLMEDIHSQFNMQQRLSARSSDSDADRRHGDSNTPCLCRKLRSPRVLLVTDRSFDSPAHTVQLNGTGVKRSEGVSRTSFLCLFVLQLLSFH